MGRKKGSKNKPKVLDDVKPKAAVMVPAKKKEPRPKEVQTVAKPAPVKKVKEKPPEEDYSVEQPSGPKYVPANLDSMFMNEHPLLRLSSTLMAKMPPHLFHKYVDAAATANEDYKLYIAKRILSSLGFSITEIENIEQEVKAYKYIKRQQLYHRVDKK